jgi:hypothetical protein
MKRFSVSNPGTLTRPAISPKSRKGATKMEISITAVSRNRKFTKSLVRHAKALAPLRHLGAGGEKSVLPFDVLQLVFMGKSEDYINRSAVKMTVFFKSRFLYLTRPQSTLTIHQPSSILSHAVWKARRTCAVSHNTSNCNCRKNLIRFWMMNDDILWLNIAFAPCSFRRGRSNENAISLKADSLTR